MDPRVTQLDGECWKRPCNEAPVIKQKLLFPPEEASCFASSLEMFESESDGEERLQLQTLTTAELL